ncbi:MAG: hypothetical protein R3C02_02765 [Planctomycetaceae bacterium]
MLRDIAPTYEVRIPDSFDPQPQCGGFLPLDLPESQAESLLNAFLWWHPHLLASAGVKPQWEQADSPPESHKNRLFIVPTVSTDWIPCQWVENGT